MQSPLLYPDGLQGESRRGSYNVWFLLHIHTSDLGHISQYHRIAEVGCHPVQPISSVRVMSRLLLSVSEWRLCNLCQRSVTLRGRVLCVSACTGCLRSCLWTSLKSLNASSLHLCFRYLCTLVRFSELLFSQLSSSSSFSLSTRGTYSSPYIIFMTLFWTLSSSSIFLALGTDLDTPLQMLFLHK